MAARDYAYLARSLSSGSAGPQPFSGGGIRSAGHAPEVIKLASQLARQKAKAGIGQPKAPSQGVIGRIFDVIQRPLYTTANTVLATQQGTNPVEAAWRGFSGQDKTTYDKVLEDMGMSGGWQRATLGFAGDIALDPTTYVGAGVIKNTAEGAAKKAAMKAVEASAEKEFGELAVQRASSAIRDASRLKTEAEGSVKVGQRISKEEADKLAIEEVTGKLSDAYHGALDTKLAEGRGKVALKIMGKQTNIGSERLYSAGSKFAEFANKSKYVKGVAQAFRPTATMRQGTNDILRRAVGWSLFDGDQALLDLKAVLGKKIDHLPKGDVNNLFGGLDVGQRQMLMKEMEAGDDGLAALAKEVIPGTGKNGAPDKTLKDYANFMRSHFDEEMGFETEMTLPRRFDSDYMPDYVPHKYNGGTPKEQAAFKKGRRDNLKSYHAKIMKAYKEGVSIDDLPRFDNSKWNLEAAEQAGLKPEKDILQAAGQRTIKSYKDQAIFRFHDAIGKEFGMDFSEGLPGGGITKKKGIKAFTDKAGMRPVPSRHFGPAGEKGTLWFDNEIADILEKGVTGRIDDPEAGSELLKMFDKVQTTWKLSMTAVNPGHHIRNFMGDVFLNYEDGVKNPLVYERSAKILREWRQNPASVTIMVGEIPMQADEVMRKFSRFGGKAGFFRQEYTGLGVRTGFAGGLRAAPGKAIESIREISELREDWTRLAHFIDVMQKEGKHVKTVEELNKVAAEAGRRVRKFNIDYGDLTPFERKFMKRVVPFYTWMRKNIPLQIETLALDPGKVSVIPKGLRALQKIVGEEGSDEELFGLNMVPKWLREMSGVRLFGEGMGRNQVYWNPSVFPFMDIAQYSEGGTEGVTAQLLGSMTPALRIPIEKAMGRRISTGAPLNEPGFTYASQQLLPPGVNPLYSILSRKGEFTDYAKLLGISAYNVGPQQRLGELRRQQDIVQALLKSKKPRQPRSWER